MRIQLSGPQLRWTRHLTAMLAVAVIVIPALGCRVAAATLPSPTAWRTYENAALGVAFEIPDYFVVKEDAGGTLFRYEGANAVLLRFVSEEDALDRGLWVALAPVAPTTLGGRTGQRYVYRHHDGPIYSLTEAYVVPHRGKHLGLEFRSQNDDAVRKRMLASFRFLAGGDATGG